MNLWKYLKLPVLLTLLLALAACGRFEVIIETPTPQSTEPVPKVVVETTVTPTFPIEASPLPSETGSETAEPSSSPDGEHLQAGVPVKIVQVHMLDPQNGWGIGQVDTDLDDHILYTSDSGQTWQDRTPVAALAGSPPNGLVATAHFQSPQLAWVAYAGRTPEPISGNKPIWFTQDGGQTWRSSQPLDLSGMEQEFYIPSDLGFLDSQHGWIMVHLGAGMSHDYIAIFTSGDGGQTWQRVVDPQKNPELMGCAKTGLVFSTRTNAWLAGDCPGLMPDLFFLRSVDVGQTWILVSFPLPEGQPEDLLNKGDAGCGIPELVYTSSRSLLIEMRCNYFQTNQTLSWLYTSGDGGLNWTPNALPAPFGEFDFQSPTEGWFLGMTRNDPSAGGELYHTVNGGRSWMPVIPTGWNGDPDFIDSQNGWIIARSEDIHAFVHTSNGGHLWRELKPVIAP